LPSSSSSPIARRAPLAPWPATPPALTALLKSAMQAGVSFGARGNLLIIAPPLVIEERELADALSLLDRLLATHFTQEARP
jgi:taurine--2-oxoglutarate transaminase